MRILGIESSCDDTGIAVIEDGNIIANEIITQKHLSGVIPEYAARFHHVAVYDSVKKVFNNIDLIAYTNGPGLMGSLFIGSSFAKGLAYAANLPTIAINHIEAHMMLPYWLFKFSVPFLALIISGGHTLMVFITGVGQYTIISRSIDDAVGEVFDKVARHIGLGYPGGCLIEELALKAQHQYIFNFPKPMQNRDDFSFSGLKTAAIQQISKDATMDQKADFCFQLQNNIAYILSEKLERIQKLYSAKNLVVSGGVAANKVIRLALENLASKLKVDIFFPDISLCGDNGVMVAALGELRYKIFGKSNLNIKPFASFNVFE